MRNTFEWSTHIIHTIFIFCSALEHLSFGLLGLQSTDAPDGSLKPGKDFPASPLFSEWEQPSPHGCDIIAFQMQLSKATLGTEQLPSLYAPPGVIRTCPVDEFAAAGISLWYLASPNTTTSARTKAAAPFKEPIQDFRLWTAAWLYTVSQPKPSWKKSPL